MAQPAREILLVTGGSRGIGAATARLAAGRGYDVCLSYADRADAAEQVVRDCEAAGARALAVQADVSVEEDVLKLFSASAELGPLGVLVNNAGVVAPKARVADYESSRVATMLAVNVLGAFLCAREAVRVMSTRTGGHGGSVVNVSSRAAALGSPGEYVDYAASKAAVDTMTLGLAREVADEGIRVNAVRPGLIETDIHASGGQPDRVDRLRSAVPMQRPGLADEVAQAVLWLASAEASYVTGTLLDVSGGR